MATKLTYVSGWSTSPTERKKRIFDQESEMTVTVISDSVENAKKGLIQEFEGETTIAGFTYNVTVHDCHKTEENNNFSFKLTRKLISIKK